MDSEKYIKNKNRELVKRTKTVTWYYHCGTQKMHYLQSNSKSSFKKLLFSVGNYFSFALFVQKKANGTTKLTFQLFPISFKQVSIL